MTTLSSAPATTPAARPASAAASAPRAPRDTAVDVARAWCLTLVVALHALMVGVSVQGGAPVLENAMDDWAGFAALTWVAQMMPLFFVLGGFSSATQWGRLRAAGTSWHDYLRMRMRRLLPPAAAAMGVTAAGLVGLQLAGIPDDVVATAGFRLSQPLWFLGVYLLCTALVPAFAALHRRAPRATLAVLAASVVAVDVARGLTGVDAIGFVNLLFLWVFVQQLGFVLADRGTAPLASPRGAWLGASAALGALVILCAVGAYSPDLFQNLNPPTAALALLGVAQLFLFDLARPVLRALHEVRPVRAVVTWIGARAMSIYSWHMLVLIGFAGLLLVVAGDALPVPLTHAWWGSRGWWIAAVLAGTAALVAVTGRIETRGVRVADAGAGPVVVLAALVAAAGGVVLVLVAGASPLAWAAGAVLAAAGFGTRLRRYSTHRERG